MTDEELLAALEVLRKLPWAERDDRKQVQDHGLNVVPANFYSSIPSIAETLSSYEYLEASPPYLDSGIFDNDKLQAELTALVPFSQDFDPPQDGDEEAGETYFWNNTQFGYSDAMSYYAYIRRNKPGAVVEIGSGFSSLLALEALQRNGAGRLKCIEPFPRPFVKSLAEKGSLELHQVRAQDITPQVLNSMLSDGDILFIDSTHTVKTGSDCLHIYLRLLPHIDKKILVHVHDIFLPFGMPQQWVLDMQIHWTEQYLLLAFLIDNPKVSVLFGSMYHSHFNPQALDALMHGRCRAGDGSFWFEYDGRR